MWKWNFSTEIAVIRKRQNRETKPLSRNVRLGIRIISRNNKQIENSICYTEHSVITLYSARLRKKASIKDCCLSDIMCKRYKLDKEQNSLHWLSCNQYDLTNKSWDNIILLGSKKEKIESLKKILTKVPRNSAYLIPLVTITDGYLFPTFEKDVPSCWKITSNQELRLLSEKISMLKYFMETL